MWHVYFQTFPGVATRTPPPPARGEKSPPAPTPSLLHDSAIGCFAPNSRTRFVRKKVGSSAGNYGF